MTSLDTFYHLEPKLVIYWIYCLPRSQPPPHCKPNKTKLKYQTLMDTLEGIGRYVTFPILNLGIRRGIQTIFTNLFEQCYIPLMPIYACMQQVHLITIMYRTLLLLNKRKSIDHQNPQGHEFPKGACLISSYKGIDNPWWSTLRCKPNMLQ